MKCHQIFLHPFLSNLIRHNTTIMTKDLIPELSLHLITPSSPWYYQSSVPELASDPFWAVYWPGGQALTRFILDNPDVVQGKTVLDIGCGNGSVSLASRLAGAHQVIANDIDLVALASTMMNCQVNDIEHPILSCHNQIPMMGQTANPHQSNIVFLGDMFYDEDTARGINVWCKELKAQGQRIFVGDPGRWALSFVKDSLERRAEYCIKDEACPEYDTTSVYEFVL